MTGYEENKKLHPFNIENIRQYKIKKTTRIFKTIQKSLMLDSHDIHELTVLVSSDKTNKQGETK